VRLEVEDDESAWRLFEVLERRRGFGSLGAEVELPHGMCRLRVGGEPREVEGTVCSETVCKGVPAPLDFSDKSSAT